MSTLGPWQVAQLLQDLLDGHDKDVPRLRSDRSHTPLAPPRIRKKIVVHSVFLPALPNHDRSAPWDRRLIGYFLINFIALSPVNSISKKFIKLTSIHVTKQCIEDYIYQ